MLLRTFRNRVDLFNENGKNVLSNIGWHVFEISIRHSYEDPVGSGSGWIVLKIQKTWQQKRILKYVAMFAPFPL